MASGATPSVDGLAQRLFAFLPTRAELDLLGWEDTNDIFLH